MPCRLKLSPLQSDIVMMLEEAGAETVGTVIATLKPSDQGEFAAQVDGLVGLGLIRKEENNLVLTEQGRIALRT
jgi:predicted transcriptional regulator